MGKGKQGKRGGKKHDQGVSSTTTTKEQETGMTAPEVSESVPPTATTEEKAPEAVIPPGQTGPLPTNQSEPTNTQDLPERKDLTQEQAIGSQPTNTNQSKPTSTQDLPERKDPTQKQVIGPPPTNPPKPPNTQALPERSDLTQEHLPQPPPQQPQPIAHPRTIHERPSLEHPPGYVQNPLAHSNVAGPSKQDTRRPGGNGYWSWADAPGLAGGRYVYTPGSDESSAAGTPEPRFRGHHYEPERNQQSEEGMDIITSGWLWQEAKSWGSAIGEKLAETEAGVWRWINRKT